MHSIVPQDTYKSYIVDAKVDSLAIQRFREFIKTRRVTLGSYGMSKTEITGTGCLGSVEKLQEGLANGDVYMKVVAGKERYFMERACDEHIAED